MSLGRCIPELVAAGKLQPDQARRMRGLYDDNVAELGKSMGPPAAEAEASRRTIEALDVEHGERRRKAQLQIKAQQYADDWLTRGGERWGRGSRGGGPGGPGGPLPGEGPAGPAIPRAARTLVGLVEARRKAIEGEAFGHVRGVLERHRRTLTGKLRRPAEMDELGRAAFGEEVDSVSAKEFAAAIAETQELLRLRANAAGANIGKLENRGFATHHDSRAVAEAGFDAWFAVELPRWDVERMVDEHTGQPFTAVRLELVARDVFDTIASDGAAKRSPGGAGQLSFANRLGQHRFIHYKNYDAWKESQAQFGAGTAFDALIGELTGMSRAVAAMEILGPNPEATVRYVKDRVAGDPSLFEPGKLRARDQAKGESARVQRLWDEYTGALRQPESRRLAVGFSIYRSIAAASKLGSAAPKAIGDIGFGMATRAFSGLPVVGIFGDYLKQLNPASKADRMLAARLGFAYATWSSMVSSQHRFLAEELTGEVAQRIADGVLRVSGLNWITDAGRAAQGIVTFAHVTQVRDQAWDALEPAWQAALQRYRIGPEQWDAIRSSPVSKDIGLLEPDNIADVEARTRLLELAHSERDFAVPVPDLEVRSWLHANAKKGTLTGELLRSSPFMFKTFTASVMMRHGGRMAEQQGFAGKAGYLLAVAVPTTVIAMMATQLLELGAGRDVRPMDDPGLWADALANGGGLGILGDLAGLTAEDRYMGWAEFAAGPLVGDVGRSVAIGVDAAQGDDRAAWKAVQLGRQNVPGQNLWYARLAIDRLLADQIQQQVDPEYAKSWRQVERRAADKEQDLWWEPGELQPERAPDFENIMQGDGR